GYDYPPRVRYAIEADHLSSYRQAAEFLNLSGLDLVCLQHEYGIFGGEDGSHIVTLLSELNCPIVTTLHTVLRQPTANQYRILKEILRLSDRVIVMSKTAKQFLQEVYNAPPDKIELIHHGIPEVAFVDPNFYKDQFGVSGKIVLLTFGLLSRNKGIENVIQALPRVLRRHPNLVYLVVGVTHPNVLRHEGERYRNYLQQLAQELGVQEHVLFFNQFVDLPKLIQFIGAADIYITPYLNREQVVSGTLAYTLGAGKAILSTPYYYAEELLANGRGLVVPFNDPSAIEEKIIWLLEHESERHAMRKRAYLYGQEMIWRKVVRRYAEVFERTLTRRLVEPQTHALPSIKLKRELDTLPEIRLDHLQRMTDDTGLLQHAIYTVPNYHYGYTTDDNARGLLLTVLLEELNGEMSAEVERLASRYLAFLTYAYHPKTHRFRNELSYQRQWLEDNGSDDCYGRAIWSLGSVYRRSNNEALKQSSLHLLQLALPAAQTIESPRANAYLLLGLEEYLQAQPGDRLAQSLFRSKAEGLLRLYQQNNSDEWEWFEEVLAYDNAVLSRGLLIAGASLQNDEMIQAALRSLRWLAEVQRAEQGHFAPVGNMGFYRRGGPKARFDQQPLEAYAMVGACLDAYRVTQDAFWYSEARRAFEWFLGNNDLNLPLVDCSTGGCRDGLQPSRVNQNQGAESTLSYLLALVEMHRVAQALEQSKAALHLTQYNNGQRSRR
ncbi:MAG: glycosyltransferase family 4 protein, partial [Anaerolineales bacterium]|nr:glycosyltransferase [Anaerolineales bacterium]MDW8448083.1 glycosyltransferase family 4 protein [Anaerolineales bacterium]